MADQKKIYVVLVEDHSNEGEDGENFVLGAYSNRAAAEKAAIAEMEEIVQWMYCEHAYFKGSDSEESWGNWDELADTEKEREEAEETYSREGISELIRKAGGQVRIESDCGLYYEITITEEELKEA